jgi:transcriptional regulator with XRE-family HTH domain
MTSKQYRKAIESLGLSQPQAARFLGVSPRTSQSYALGETRIPEPVAKLLRITIELKLNPDKIEGLTK